MMIQLRSVSKRYAQSGVERAVVDGVSFGVEKGEMLALLGGSGSGKTTTLKMINRLVEPTAGIIEIDGKDNKTIPAHELRRSIGYVLQEIGLFPHMSIEQNVAITLQLLGWPRPKMAARVRELLPLVGLDPAVFCERFPAQLSGGQRQRVGIARALAAHPRVMLLDEPFGALDPITRRSLQRLLLRVWKEIGLTAVIVTHDIQEARVLGSRIAVMREGKLLQIGTFDEIASAPADAYVRSLLSETDEVEEQGRAPA